MKKIVMLFFVVLFLNGCFKNGEQTTKVSGMVIDYGSKEPIEGVLVQLRDGLGGTDPLTGEPLGTDEKATTITNNEGRFDVEVTGEWGAHLSIHKEDYWNYTYITPNGGSSSSAKPYEKGSINKDEVLKLKAMGWFGGVLHFNIIPDSIEFASLYEDLSPTGSSGRKAYNKKVIDYYESPFYAIGNDYFRYLIKYKTDGIWHEIIDSVYVPKGEIFHDTLYF